MNKYWTISGGTILESDKPIRCKFEGLELEPLNHASAKRLAEEAVSRQDSRFLLVKNYNGAAMPGVDFTLTDRPSVCASRCGPDTCILLPSYQKMNGISCDLSFLVDGLGIWVLFAVTDNYRATSARQRLDDNLWSVFG